MNRIVALYVAGFLVACSADIDPTDPAVGDADAGLPTDAAGAAFLGGYDLEWTCVHGCIRTPPFAYNDRLLVTGGDGDYELTFYRSLCEECTTADVARLDGDCLTASGIPVADNPTDAYRLCP